MRKTAFLLLAVSSSRSFNRIRSCNFLFNAGQFHPFAGPWHTLQHQGAAIQSVCKTSVHTKTSRATKIGKPSWSFGLIRENIASSTILTDSSEAIVIGWKSVIRVDRCGNIPLTAALTTPPECNLVLSLLASCMSWIKSHQWFNKNWSDYL